MSLLSKARSCNDTIESLDRGEREVLRVVYTGFVETITKLFPAVATAAPALSCHLQPSAAASTSSVHSHGRHDLLLPCNESSCTTQRVILRRRKRAERAMSDEPSKRAHTEVGLSAALSECNESAAEVFRCLSCFSFIPTGIDMSHFLF